MSHSPFLIWKQCYLCNNSLVCLVFMGINEVAAGWKMMTSRCAVPAAGSLHVGGSSSSCPAISFPPDDELGQGFRKISGLMGGQNDLSRI